MNLAERAEEYVRANGGSWDTLVRELEEVRTQALAEAAALIRRVRCRTWTPEECAFATETLDHPPECSCHRWVDCMKEKR